jgi:hypothetical protein
LPALKLGANYTVSGGGGGGGGGGGASIEKTSRAHN